MIEYIKGELTELSPTEAVIEAAGIGYLLSISLGTYSAIQGKKAVRLFVYEVIREDTHLLYGFSSRSERTLFELLIGISGIGGQTARLILSAYAPGDLAALIRNENAGMLKAIKGIGPKAAQRIIVELRDKIPADLEASAPAGEAGNAGTIADTETVKEAVAALTMLGFPPAPTQKAVREIVKQRPGIPVEEVIKLGLKML